MKKPNRRDLTERNLDAQKKVNARFIAQLAKMKERVDNLERALAVVLKTTGRR